MLQGKVAVVTGSTSGIGLGIAKALAYQSCDIMLNGFGKPLEIEAIRSGLEAEFGGQVGYCDADLSKPEEVRRLIGETEAQLGRVDILVNNAGIQHTEAIEDFPDDRWEAIVGINLSAVFYATKAALPGMKRRDWGRIINIASAHGLVASPFKAAYVAAKHGVVGLTKVTALETAELPITCNAICPGWVRTPLVEKQIEALAADKGLSIEDAARELLGAKQPSKGFVSPEQLGQLVVHLCLPASEQITGSALSMDGGWTAQ